MQYVPASHGAVVLGVLPLVTALFGRMRSHERPSPLFWLSSVAGSLVVVIFALRAGGGSFHVADLALFAAIVFAAVGYAEGGHLAREMGGWQVICWALLMAAPVLLFSVGFALWQHGFSPTPVAWLGFSYVSIFSMFFCLVSRTRCGRHRACEPASTASTFFNTGFFSALIERRGWPHCTCCGRICYTVPSGES